MAYVEKLEKGDDVFTVQEFKGYCADGSFIDYDGFGHPVKNGKADPSISVKPSLCAAIPSDATHVVWYNR
jgi:hypothetical protein